jgi:transcriptional regulator with XRE-family HTH domain
VSTQAVSKWESGGYPDIELIPRIAKYFNVTTDELFGLPVNDCKNIEQRVAIYLGSLPSNEERFA